MAEKMTDLYYYYSLQCWHYFRMYSVWSLPDIIRMMKSRRMKWPGHVARMGAKRNAYRIFVGKPEGRRPLGRGRCRLVDNIKMDPREIGWDGMDWINLAQDSDQSIVLSSGMFAPSNYTALRSRR
jgi:hypothetical protein